jgi:nucleoside-triphosphatase THEP1
MECLSNRFCQQLKIIFDSDYPVIATLSAGALEPVNDFKKRSDVVIIRVNNRNRDSVWKNVLLELR